MISRYLVRFIKQISLLVLPLAVWPSSGAVAQTAGASAVLEEIVVTARRREENLQTVPISVMAFTAEDLEVRGVDNILRLNVLVPNVSINGGAIFGVTSSEILIRGIPGVAVYQDGFLQGSAGGATGVGLLRNVVELERVEILRGPQGTLFGKNSSGGAIQYITTQPGEEFGARIKTTIGSFNRLDVVANVDLPLSDTLLAKVTGASLTRDGHVESTTIQRDYGDVNNQILRADGLWTPNDNVRARFIAEYSGSNTNGQARVVDAIGAPVCAAPPPPNFSGPIPNSPCAYAGAGLPYTQATHAFPGEYKTASNFGGEGNELNEYSVLADIEWDISDSLTLKSISGWREWDYHTYVDVDASEYNMFELYFYRERELFTQEFQLQGSGEQLNWTAGVYYLDTDDRSRQPRWINHDLNFGPFPITSDGGAETLTDSWAVFAEGTYALTDQLDLTVGVRYTEETVEGHFVTPSGPTPPLATIFRNADGPNGFGGKETFDAVTPRVALQYQVNDDIMMYVSYAEGFSAGGLNTREDPNLPNNGLIPFDEELLKTVELGWRSDLLNGRLRLNASLFTSVWEDIIIAQELVPTRFTRTNVGEAEASGLEIEGLWGVTDSLRVNFALGWLDTEYTDLGPPGGVPLDVTLGSPFPFAADFNYSLGLQHNAALANGGTLSTRLDYGWQDDVITARGDANNFLQEAYGVLSARLTYAPEGGDWDIALFGTNLTDEYYQTGGFWIPPLQIRQFTLARPREIGITMRFNFD